MTVPEEEKRSETGSAWNKSWIFLMALLCILTLAGLGSWGRVRMLEDDNAQIEKKLEAETKVHMQEEVQLRNHLRSKSRQFGTLRRQMALTTHHFQRLNSSMKDVKAHLGQALELADHGPSQFLSECHGVTLPKGFEFAPKDQVIFPHDVSRDATGLHALLKSSESLAPVYDVTTRAEKAGLFIRPTFPWAEWTWLQALLDSEIAGNFTEWGVGAGGSALFLASVARLQGASLAGFDAWDKASEAEKQKKQFAEAANQCGLSVPKDVELYDLSANSIPWPTAGHNERLAFTHIDSDDYQTTLGILEVVYGSTVEGGIFALDNFFHPSGGSKRAVEDFFRKQTPGKLPLIYPVFPGFSVMIFKNHFANTTKGDRPNALDGNYYSFKYIKGQPEVFNSVNRSVAHLSEVHQNVKDDPKANQTSLCYLSLTLHNARNLRDFVQSSDAHVEDFEAADVFRFMADNSQFIGSAQTA